MKSRFFVIFILALWRNAVSKVPSDANQDSEAANHGVEKPPLSSAEGTSGQHLDIAKDINIEEYIATHDQGGDLERVSREQSSYGRLQEDILANLSHDYLFPWPYDVEGSNDEENLMPYFTAHTADGLEVELLMPIDQENIDIISETGDHLLKEAEDFYKLMTALIKFVKGLKQNIRIQHEAISLTNATSEPTHHDDIGSLESYYATNTTVCPLEQIPDPTNSEDVTKVGNTNSKWEDSKNRKYFKSAMKYLAKAAKPKPSLKGGTFDDINFNQYIPGIYDILNDDTHSSATIYSTPYEAKHSKEDDLQKANTINNHTEDINDLLPYDIHDLAPVTQEESPVAATGGSSLPEQDNDADKDTKTQNYILADYFRGLLQHAIFGF